MAPEQAGRDLLLFGDGGIEEIVGFEREQVWDGPVIAAYPDGAGGVVFQDAGARFGAIRWLRAGTSEPVVLVAGAELANLHGVAVVDGSTEVLFTRTNQDVGDVDGPDREERWERLYARDLATGGERDLGETGGIESGLDTAATADIGLLVSTCHLQCRVHVLGGPDDGTELRQPDWIEGLDAEGGAMAFVREVDQLTDHPIVDAELVVQAVGGEELATVRLPRSMAVQWRVDLAPTGDAALVWIVDYATGGRGAGGAMLVEGIGSASPTVRALEGAGGARFLDPPTDPAVPSFHAGGLGTLAFDDPRPEAEVDAYLGEVVGPSEEDSGWVDGCVPEERRILWTYASVTLVRRAGRVQLVSWTVTWVPGHGPSLAAPFAPGTSSAIAEALGASWDEADGYWELHGFAGTVDEPAPGPTAPPGSVIEAVHAGTWRC